MEQHDRFEQVQSLFDQISGIDPAEREQRLAELCDDPAIRREVLDLCAYDSNTMFAKVQGAVDRSISGGGNPPEIDGFVLHEIIGSGAMGVVYRGEQSQPHRPVAIKLLQTGIASASMQHRFRSEAEALARLQHPCIAAVYQSGVASADGRARPFLAMEYVDGVRLDRWIEQNNPSTKERLQLICKLCDAVQHAHSRGVIHRDLKPSNILITKDGNPKLIDFGVARITDRSQTMSMQTGAGEMVGTLAYMSPEQFSGDPSAIDTRSDVYALGVVMFYLLSGTLPHDVTTMSITTAARAVEEHAPKRLGSIKPEFRGDLDTITSHTLAKEKDKRYQTADALKDDVERFLSGLPINARPPSAVYVLSRFAKRHKMPVIAASFAVLALIGAAVFSFIQASIAHRALDESREAEKRLSQANDDLVAAGKRLNDVNDFLIVDMIQAALGEFNGVNTRVVDAVELAIPKVKERFGDDPIGEARVRFAISRVLASLGRYQESLDQSGLGLAVLEQHDLTHAWEYVEVLSSQALTRDLMGQPDIAEKVYAKAIDAARAAHNQDEKALYALLPGMRGGTLANLRRFDEAEELLVKSVQYLESQDGPIDRNIMGMYTQLYRIAFEKGDNKRRHEINDRITELGAYFGDPNSTYTAMHFRAMTLALDGDFEGVIQPRHEIVDFVKQHSDELSYQYRMALESLAGAYARVDRFAESEPYWLQLLDLNIRALGPYHYEVEKTYGYIYEMYDRWEKPEKAKHWREKNLHLRFYVAGPNELESLQVAFQRGSELLGSDDAFFDSLLAEAEASKDAVLQRPAYLANIGRILAEHDDPRTEQVLTDSFDAIDPQNAEMRPLDIIARIRDALPAYLERAGRDDEAADSRARLDEMAAISVSH
ncbi:MAG: serine/threonine-protein kinase [Phycisphaerales bacterium]|nr:serine/threonine protein kinase [Phycisphaerales bacterium]